MLPATHGDNNDEAVENCTLENNAVGAEALD